MVLAAGCHGTMGTDNSPPDDNKGGSSSGGGSAGSGSSKGGQAGSSSPGAGSTGSAGSSAGGTTGQGTGGSAGGPATGFPGTSEGPPPIPSATGDRWSDPKTWMSGKVPVKGEKVTIPSGKTVLLDVDPPQLASLEIAGALVFDNRDTQLSSDAIMVNGGRLQVGTVKEPFTKRAVITLTGGDPASPDVDTARAGMGVKLLGVVNGILDLHGTPSGVNWTKLDGDVAAGATSIKLLEAPLWKAGDQIVIATSSFDQADTEHAEVASVDGKTVTLKKALAHPHFGTIRKVEAAEVDIRAEVALISHNIVVQGDEQSETQRLGGHMMFMATKSTTVRLSNIEVTRMGQYNHLGRYPIHFHLIGDKCDGCTVTDVTVHDTVQRGIVVHDTSAVTVKNNVVHNSMGHNFIVETVTTKGNLFDNNLAIVNRQPNPGFTVEALKAQNDDIPTGFWIRNANNIFQNNHVAGSTGMGMWFDQSGEAPINLVNTVVHAAMTVGAPRDFNMQSGLLVDCGVEQPATGQIKDALVYQSGIGSSLGKSDGVGFWIEHCTSFTETMTPFKISNIKAIDNGGRDFEVRGQRQNYIVDDLLVTGNLLGDSNRRNPVAVFFQYGGTLTLNNPVFAHFSDNGLLVSNDILGLWIARFRLAGVKMIDVKPDLVIPNSLTEALDDSYLPKGSYVVRDGDKPTVVADSCMSVNMPGDYGVYKCPLDTKFGFLILSDGNQFDKEGERLTNGTPMHTEYALKRNTDGAEYKPGSYGFGGYEIALQKNTAYSVAQQPKGIVAGSLDPMGSVTTGIDKAAYVDVWLPMASAPSSVARTTLTGDGSVIKPADSGKMKGVSSQADLDANAEGSYWYDSGAKMLKIKAGVHPFVITP